MTDTDFTFMIHKVIQCPKKMSYFAWVQAFKVGHFFWDTVYINRLMCQISLHPMHKLGNCKTCNKISC